MQENVSYIFNVDLTDYMDRSFKTKWFKQNLHFRVFLMQPHTIHAGMGKADVLK